VTQSFANCVLYIVTFHSFYLPYTMETSIINVLSQPKCALNGFVKETMMTRSVKAPHRTLIIKGYFYI